MKGLLIAVAALVASVALAACGGGGGGDSAGADASSNGSKTVSAEQIGDAGNVLVGAGGKALYASDQETHGKVLCTGACLSFWTPLTVSGTPTGSSLTGKLAVVKRPDGKKQVTYNGKLLYSFTQDKPGKVTGDGFDDAFGGRQFTWHVVHGDNTSSSGSKGADSGGGSSLGY
jgi:predicted lipoprotein with Yx(FWY)xxD motif